MCKIKTFSKVNTTWIKFVSGLHRVAFKASITQVAGRQSSQVLWFATDFRQGNWQKNNVVNHHRNLYDLPYDILEYDTVGIHS